MQIQKLSLELEQVVLSQQTTQTDDKQIDLLQTELDKRCDELTAMKLAFQQDTAKIKNEARETIEMLEMQNKNMKLDYDARLRNLEIECENR